MTNLSGGRQQKDSLTGRIKGSVSQLHHISSPEEKACSLLPQFSFLDLLGSKRWCACHWGLGHAHGGPGAGDMGPLSPFIIASTFVHM